MIPCGSSSASRFPCSLRGSCCGSCCFCPFPADICTSGLHHVGPSLLGRVPGGVGSQRPIWFPDHRDPGPHAALHRKRSVVVETRQDDRGARPRAEEEAEETGEHRQSQEDQEGLRTSKD